MAVDYDSDSTEGEYEETNVLLGYASKDAGDDTISRLGGRAVREAIRRRPVIQQSKQLTVTIGMA